jgi:DNA-directed RNA polymerase specialized sigma24 family protein
VTRSQPDLGSEGRHPRLPPRWVLTKEAFDKLLAWLDPDRESAAVKYEHIRRVLTMFFERRTCSPADEYADKTINIVTRRLDEGEEVRTLDRSAFFYGVAKNVFRQSLRERRHVELSAVDPVANVRRPSRLQECLEECLGNLPAEDRELLEAYYLGDRDGLAETLGITRNALRIRVFKVKQEIRAHVKQCLD